MTDTKPCPDCAEQVLAAARKCRYCGYRFDRRQGGALLDNLRTNRWDVKLPELLIDWGVGLRDDEEIRWFGLAEADGASGYLLVTGSRLIFFAQRGRSSYSKLFEHPRSSLSRMSIGGRCGRRRLTLSGQAFAHVVRLTAGGKTQDLADLLDPTAWAPGSRVAGHAE